MKPYMVYMLTSPNGKRYIGMTRAGLQKRCGRGSRYKYNKILYADIEKYGWDSFEKSILADNLSEDEASNLEQFWIKKIRHTKSPKGIQHRKRRIESRYSRQKDQGKDERVPHRIAKRRKI